MEELEAIMQKFAASGWYLIAVPAQEWLDRKADKDTLVSAIKQADYGYARYFQIRSDDFEVR